MLVKQSDGSFFRIRTTSPKTFINLTKDTANHGLWNPSTASQFDDQGGQVARFNRRFEGAELLGGDGLLGLGVGAAPAVLEKKTVVKVVEVSKKAAKKNTPKAKKVA